jgi:hypothetical protein
MQIVPVDLTKNPRVADLLVDMQPGQRVYACLTIKDKDEKNANLRIEEIVATPEELPQPDEAYPDEEDGTIGKGSDGEGGAEAAGANREQTDGSGAAPIDSAGQTGPGGG